MNITNAILAIIFIYVVNILFQKNSILLNNNGEKHQNYTSDGKVPLTGGIFLLALLTLFFYNSKNEIIIISLSFLFLLGISSDLKILNSPRLRVLFQAIIVFSTIYILNLTILRTGIEFIDFILSYHYFNLLFVTFCILIVINGTNFIDGLNGLAIGYYSIILYQLVIMNFFISGEFFFESRIYYIIFFFYNFICI
jgi:UDP-N-acetylmuramyl pentapeptide phosphotransferase/UDP-N-acetylglucosamine-1-phosphate transferase